MAVRRQLSHLDGLCFVVEAEDAATVALCRSQGLHCPDPSTDEFLAECENENSDIGVLRHDAWVVVLALAEAGFLRYSEEQLQEFLTDVKASPDPD